MPAPFPSQRTAVVTGAASARGIGRVTALKLAAQAWNLGILDSDEAGAVALASQIAADHRVRAKAIGVDVTDQATVHAAIDQIESELP